jgi:hypothetical protein
VPRKRRKAKARFGELDHEQLLYLIIGRFEAACFEDEDEAKELYRLHRDRVLAGTNEGHRPLAFWDFEVGERPQKGETDLACLRRLGLSMSEKERRILEKQDQKEQAHEER